jgi:predicted metal-dependent hydrolase
MKTMVLNNTELNRGVSLFNRAHFFDAHEVLEDVWNSVPRDRPSGRHLRQHIQGMVQLAVAFHHQSKGNHVGARSVLERAMRNISGADNSFPDLDLDRLRAELALWRRYLDNSGGNNSEATGEKKLAGRDARRHDVLNSSAPPLPKIMPRR